MSAKKLNTVKLSVPLKDGDKEIDNINLRKPNAGELRGVAVLQLMQMQPEEFAKLVPRISTPMINEHLFNQLDLADMMDIMTTVQGFFMKDPSLNP